MQNGYSHSAEIVCDDMCSVEDEEARGTANSGAVIKYQQEVAHTTTELFISLKQMLWAWNTSSIKQCEHTDKIKDIKLRENYERSF